MMDKLPMNPVQHIIATKIASARDDVAHLKAAHGDTVLSTVTVRQFYEGIRQVPCILYETANLDLDSTIKLRGHTLQSCYHNLPRPPHSSYPYVEAMFWLLLTAEVPSVSDVVAFQGHLRARATVPHTVLKVIDALPPSTAPMIQLSAALLAMSGQSAQRAAFNDGVPKQQLWTSCLDDVLTLCAVMPRLGAYIYHRSFNPQDVTKARLSVTQEFDDLDLAADFANRMGFDSHIAHELFRLYLTLHMDVGGGAMSAFSAQIVGSTLSDAFLSWNAGLNALAGPSHGNANQEVMRWLKQLEKFLDGHEASDTLLKEFCWTTLNAGRVIPGYGHAAFKQADSRFFMLRDFAKDHFPDGRMCFLANRVYEVVPGVLRKHGKTKNPQPNVDAYSGALLHALGMTEESFYTVMFGVSRGMGPMTNLVWSRALCMPVTAPFSLTTDQVKNMVGKKTTS